MCVGVTNLEKLFQLSGCTNSLVAGRKTRTNTSNVNARSFASIPVRYSPPSATSDADMDGDWRWSSTRWMAISTKHTIPRRKCNTVNLRNDQEVTVALPNTHPTASSPRYGTTVRRFRITRAAQYDMFPDTTTYPVKAVPRLSRNRIAPIAHIKSLEVFTTLLNAIAFEKCPIVAMITKLAPNMCSRRRSQTRFPWKQILSNSAYCSSRDQDKTPSSMNPVSSCATQKTNATNAMLCPKCVLATGNSATSCFANRPKICTSYWRRRQVVGYDKNSSWQH